MSKRTAIWWIRRDLRLRENQALHAALDHADKIIPLFILDSGLLDSPYVGPKRVSFLFDGLQKLDHELRQRGGQLIVRSGNPAHELSAVVQETAADVIFAEEDFSPYARRRDGHINRLLPLMLLPGLVVHPPGLIRKKNGRPYTVFTPFSKAWKALPLPQQEDLLPAPGRIDVPHDLTSLAIPQGESDMIPHNFPAGESEARRRLSQFVSGPEAAVYSYAQSRNVPGVNGTSQLSPYLRFGMISARETAEAAVRAINNAPSGAARDGAEVWLNELIWREFYVNILYHFPHVRGANYNPKYDNVQWINDSKQLRAWQEGRTGYPIVDAAMRQLVQSGWMHNRTRMISASFLVKDLLIDWRLGEQWFMQHLIDGDPAANNGGWQWTAGTGTDAAPYFRIFNPITQSKKFDSRGIYIRRWLPELGNVPDKNIHEPWLMSREDQIKSGCIIGRDYPAPIVEHAAARERTLSVYKSATG